MTRQLSSDEFEWEGVFILPQGKSQGGGFVTVRHEGTSISIELMPAKAELIHVLNAALFDDCDRDRIVRGSRASDQVILALGYPLEEQSLSKAVSQINVSFRKAAAKVGLNGVVPDLIATKRSFGYRLNWRLDLEVPGAQIPG